MSQKRPYEAVTGRQEIPGVGGESGTMAAGGDEEPRAKVARGSDHQWVRNGYVPKDVEVRANQERQDEIDRLKKMIHEREVQLEIERLKKSINEKTKKQVHDKYFLEQKSTDEKLEVRVKQERKFKIKQTFQNAFKVKELPSIPKQNSDKSIISVTQSDVDRLLNSKSDFQCLQVETGERLSVIKKKYKELAKAFHPDKCQLTGAKEAFQRLNRAYQNLLKLSS